MFFMRNSGSGLGLAFRSKHKKRTKTNSVMRLFQWNSTSYVQFLVLAPWMSDL